MAIAVRVFTAGLRIDSAGVVPSHLSEAEGI